MSIGTCDVTEAVSGTLRRAVGDDRNAAKLLARAANTNTATARNWLQGRNAPGLAHFVRLCLALPELKGLARQLLGLEDATADPEFDRLLSELVTRYQRGKG